MVKAKDMSDSLDGKFSQAEAKEEAERGKKTSIKIVSPKYMWMTEFRTASVFGQLPLFLFRKVRTIDDRPISEWQIARLN